MKAISIKQPWAGLIVAGLKTIENRTWMVKYRGPLVIVSTKTMADPNTWRKARALVKKLGLTFPESICEIDGKALGVVTLAYMLGYDDRGKVITEPDHPHLAGLELAWWNRDGYGWIFEDPRQLRRALAVSGRLGLYDIPEDVAAKIATELQL